MRVRVRVRVRVEVMVRIRVRGQAMRTTRTLRLQDSRFKIQDSRDRTRPPY